MFHSFRSLLRIAPFGLPRDLFLGQVGLHYFYAVDLFCSLMSHFYADDVRSYKHCWAPQVRLLLRSKQCLAPRTGRTAWIPSNRLSPEKLNIFGSEPASSRTSWTGGSFLLNSCPLSSPPLSGTWGSFGPRTVFCGTYTTALTRSCYLSCVSCCLSITLICSPVAMSHAFIVNRLLV